MLTTTCPHCQQALGVSVMALSVQQAAFAMDPKSPAEVIESVCAARSVPVEDLLLGRMDRATVDARHACIDELTMRWPKVGPFWVARQLHVSVSTINAHRRAARKRGAA